MNAGELSWFLSRSFQLCLYHGHLLTRLKVQNVSKSWHGVNHPTLKLTGPLVAQHRAGGFLFLLTHTSVRAGAFLSKRKGELAFHMGSCILVHVLLTR